MERHGSRLLRGRDARARKERLAEQRRRTVEVTLGLQQQAEVVDGAQSVRVMVPEGLTAHLQRLAQRAEERRRHRIPPMPLPSGALVGLHQRGRGARCARTISLADGRIADDSRRSDAA